jgi:hypothetical protein
MQMQIPHGAFLVRISLGGLVAAKLQDLGLMISKWSPLVLRLGLTMRFSKRNMRARCPGFRVLLDTNPGAGTIQPSSLQRHLYWRWDVRSGVLWSVGAKQYVEWASRDRQPIGLRNFRRFVHCHHDAH